MSDTITINLDKISPDDARNAIECITKYINRANKEVIHSSYPGSGVFENKHLLISYADSVNSLLKWIKRHEERTVVTSKTKVEGYN